MHVLIVPSWYRSEKIPLNGSFFYEQAASLSELVDKVGIIYPNFESIRSIDRKIIAAPRGFLNYNIGKVNEVHINRIGIPNRKIRFMQWKFALRNLLDEYIYNYGVPDVIHVQGAYFAGAASIHLAQQRNIPVIYSEHSSYVISRNLNRWDKEILRFVVSNSQISTAVSSHLAQTIESYSRKRINILPNFIDFSLFEIPNGVESKRHFSFVFVGFLNKNKRVNLIIEAFFRSFTEKDKVNLVIVGSGPEYNSLRAMVDRQKRHHQVSLVGEVGRDKIPQLLSQSDCLISASLNETFGVSIIEAHAAGLYVIATDSGGPRDIISSDNGTLIDRSGLDLSDTMSRVYENRHSISKHEIRLSSQTRYSSQVITRRLIKLYNDTIEGGRGDN